MLRSECFHGDTQLHRFRAVGGNELVVLQFDNIGILPCDDSGHTLQFAGTVRQEDGHRKDTVTKDQTLLHYRRHRDDIHIPAGKDRHDLLIFAVKLLQCRHRKQSGVEITEKDSKFQCDGVLGLGYSFSQSYGNIYEVLAKMYNVFPSKKVLSYDKKKMQITLGEIPERSNYNPTVYPIYEKPDYPGTFIQLEKLRFMTDYDQTKYLSEEDLKDDALLTLLPVIIAPKHRLKNLYTNYTTIFNTSKSTYSKKGEIKDNWKFYSDFYLTNPNKHMDYIELVFDRMAYKFKPWEEKDGKFRPKIRFGNDEKYLFKYWIVGIDVIGVDRFDINFEDNNIKLYSKPSYDITKSKPQLLRDVFVYMTVICVMLCFMFLVFCQKKRAKDIKPGEELIELN